MTFSQNVIQIVSRTLGTEPGEIAPTGSPYALFLDVNGHQLVAKISTPTRPRSVLVEAWAYQECQRRGVRVPKVIAVSHEPECIIVEVLPGQSLWSEARRAQYDRVIWNRVGEDLRTIHEIHLNGFGPLIITDNADPRGEADSWCPFVRYAREQGIHYLVDAEYMSFATAQRLERRYDDAAPLLNNCTDGRLLHGDLEGGHVFSTTTGDYTGLIDFGLAQAGDPRWDLARVILWDGHTALDALLDGYGHDTVTQDDRDIVFPLYLLAFVMYQCVLFDRTGRRADVQGHLQQVL